MIQLHITETGKGYSPKDTFMIFHQETKTFQNIGEVKVYLKERYGNAKRRGMYVDGKDGEPMKIGYVIGFRNADWSHAPVEKWIQQDWIEFREVKRMAI